MSKQRKRIVIVGANFAGLAAASKLSTDYAVTVVDPTRHFEWIPNIHELVSGVKTGKDLRLDRAHIVSRAGHRFVQGRVLNVDTERHVVVTDTGRELGFDVCIVAIGANASTFCIRGADDNTYPLHGVTDGEAVACALHTLQRDKQPMRLVIVGAGISGIETLGEVLRRYGDNPSLSVDMVEAGARLLPGLPAKLDADIRKLCQPLPVEFHTGTRIARVAPKSVLLDNGRRIPSALTLWTAGLAPPALLRASGLARGGDVWAPVSRTLQSAYSEQVFLVGDAAALPKPLAKQVFHALDMGHCGAVNAQRFLEGRALQAFKSANKPLVITFGELQTYLVAGRTVVANRSLAAAKEGLYQVYMAQMAPRGVLQTLPGVADRLLRSWDTLLKPQLEAFVSAPSRSVFARD